MQIGDVVARNLLARMLATDPAKRPNVDQIMAHPFLSRKARVARLVGEEASFDVFLSYRVNVSRQFVGLF